MAGVKGRSGGSRAGSGRKPGSTTRKMKFKGVKKATKKAEQPTTVVQVNKITAFFAEQPASRLLEAHET